MLCRTVSSPLCPSNSGRNQSPRSSSCALCLHMLTNAVHPFSLYSAFSLTKSDLNQPASKSRNATCGDQKSFSSAVSPCVSRCPACASSTGSNHNPRPNSYGQNWHVYINIVIPFSSKISFSNWNNRRNYTHSKSVSSARCDSNSCISAGFPHLLRFPPWRATNSYAQERLSIYGLRQHSHVSTVQSSSSISSS